MKSFALASQFTEGFRFSECVDGGLRRRARKSRERQAPGRTPGSGIDRAGCVAAADKGLCIIFTAGSSLRGEQACFVSELDAKLLAQLLMGEAPDGAGELTVDDRDAAAEVFRQVAGQVASI